MAARIASMSRTVARVDRYGSSRALSPAVGDESLRRATLRARPRPSSNSGPPRRRSRGCSRAYRRSGRRRADSTTRCRSGRGPISPRVSAVPRTKSTPDRPGPPGFESSTPSRSPSAGRPANGSRMWSPRVRPVERHRHRGALDRPARVPDERTRAHGRAGARARRNARYERRTSSHDDAPLIALGARSTAKGTRRPPYAPATSWPPTACDTRLRARAPYRRRRLRLAIACPCVSSEHPRGSAFLAEMLYEP